MEHDISGIDGLWFAESGLCALSFKETLEPERRLKLNFQQVLSLYRSIFQDPSFRRPLYAGCFSGAVMFCYISASSAILMDRYHFTEQQFAYAFGANAVGIMLFRH